MTVLRNEKGNINPFIVIIIAIILASTTSLVIMNSNDEKDNSIHINDNTNGIDQQDADPQIEDTDVNTDTSDSDSNNVPTDTSNSEPFHSSSTVIDDTPSEPENSNSDKYNDICDLNCDSFVNDRDLKIVNAYYGIAYTPLCNDPDIDGNGIVELSDLAAVLAVYGPCDENCREDLICDQVIDDRDINIIKAYYGISYTPLCKNPDFNTDGIVDLSDLAELLAAYE